MSYVNINEVVDYYFLFVSILVKGGGEEYIDFKYWCDEFFDLDVFLVSGSDDDGEDDDEDDDGVDDQGSVYVDDDEEEIGDGLGDSYIFRDLYDDGVEEDSVFSNSVFFDQ